ncbi:MAG: hypothetical protein QXS41_03665 [Candidatus Woesearchaeota archaeon]
MLKIFIKIFEKYFEFYENLIIYFMNLKKSSKKNKREIIEIIKHKDKQIARLRKENKQLFLMLQRITNENIELKKQLKFYNTENKKENENEI